MQTPGPPTCSLKERSGLGGFKLLQLSREVCFLVISQDLQQEVEFSSAGWFQKSQGSSGTVPPSQPSSQEQRQLVPPTPALRPRRPPWPVCSDMSCWHRSQHCSRALRGPLEMKDMLVSCAALHSGQAPRDKRRQCQHQSWRSWGLRLSDLSHQAAQRRPKQSTSPGDRGSSRVGVPTGEDGAPSVDRTESWPCPLELVLAPTIVTYTLEATSLAQCVSHTAQRQRPLVESSASPRPVAVNMPTYHRQNILLQYYKHYVHDSQHAFCVTH